MKRLKIAILFGSKPNFNKDAFKYFILYVNKIQNIYEFFFTEIQDYPFGKGIVVYNTIHDEVNTFIKKNEIIADYFITIISNKFADNFFFNAELKISIITTDIWDKKYSPPSLFEYLLHCIFTCLIYSQVVKEDTKLTDEQLLIDIGSHSNTIGCIADFTRQKLDKKIGISLGYICEQHLKEIKQYYGESYLNELQYVIERKWIGCVEEKDSVAYNLKHFFKYNINKESGFNKNFWEKIKDKFFEIPGSLVSEVLKIILTSLLIYYLIKLGLIKNI